GRRMTSGRLLFVCLVLTLVASVTPQECSPCDDDECPTLAPKSCIWGMLKDPCLCCHVCAKGPGEECGGRSLEFGVCGPGLTCIISQGDPDAKGVCNMRFLATHFYPYRGSQAVKQQ
ncbi:hypothetical protein OTU49_006778, partial [Cherax quadricarinatus]